MFALVLGACRAPDPDAEPNCDTDAAASPDAQGTADTSLDGPASVLEASCALHVDHPLLVTCDATLDRAAPLALVVTGGAHTRVFEEVEPGTDHTFLAWGLRPETPYTWELGTRTGTFTTGSLPPDLAAARVEVTGTARGFDAVLQPLKCPDKTRFVMFDGEGEVVWFQPARGFSVGYDWSPADRTVLAITHNVMAESHVSGEERLILARDVHFEHALHHDVARWNGFTYLLQEYPAPVGNLDLVEVFEGTQSLGAFRLEDHFDLKAESVGDDWAHSNAIKPTPTGEMILSLHHFDTVIGFDADPCSPTFLERTFQASGGTERALPGADFAPVDAASGFASQHHAQRHGDELWLMDNKSVGVSRGLRLAMDAEAGTLTATGVWAFERICPTQGGAYPLPGGGALLTCTANGRVFGFADDGVDPEWTLEASCSENGGPIIRAIPIEIR